MNDKEISKFDALVTALHNRKQEEKKQGKGAPDTPNLDKYIEKKKQKSGSPPKEARD